MKRVKHWSRLASDVVLCQSLEEFKANMKNSLSNLV